MNTFIQTNTFIHHGYIFDQDTFDLSLIDKLEEVSVTEKYLLSNTTISFTEWIFEEFLANHNLHKRKYEYVLMNSTIYPQKKLIAIYSKKSPPISQDIIGITPLAPSNYNQRNIDLLDSLGYSCEPFLVKRKYIH